MRLASCLVVVFSIVGLTAPGASQTADTAVPAAVAARVPLTVSDAGCPVRFSAERYGLTATLRETGRGTENRYTQSIKLSLERLAALRISRLAITVHGKDGSLEMLPLARPSSTEVTESFVLVRPAGRSDGTYLLQTKAIPVVSRVEITEIDFDDGSVWRRSQQSLCSVQPSLLVLVGEGATRR